jgi:molybdopterin biosynthesis enzyme
MLPGRSILCGLLGATLVVALPGPPYAVRTLIHELVGPLLLLQQGAADYRPQTITAMLTESCRLRAGDLLQVKAGVLTITGTTCTVRPAASSETISCFMLFPPGRQDFLPGTVIEVHPVAGAGHGGV